MRNHLNDINPERIPGWIVGSTESAAIRAASFAKTPSNDFATLGKHAYHLAKINIDLASYRHLLSEEPKVIVAPLRAAAQWCVTMLESRTRGKVKGSGVWTLHLGDVGLVTAFGTREQRAAMGGIAPEACVSNSELASVSARTTLLWHELLGTGEVAERAAQGVLTDSEAENADRWDRQWIHGIVRALLGVSRRNAEELNGGLEETLTFHRYLATRGGWEHQTEGLLSMVALGLMRLGLEAGLTINIDSDYAPLALLKVDRI